MVKLVSNSIKKKENISDEKFQRLVSLMSDKLLKEQRDDNPFTAKNILLLVADGIFSLYAMRSDLYRSGKGYLADPEATLVWKRFNIPYLKRTLNRLEKQKLVKITEEKGKQIVAIKEKGRQKVLQYALDSMTIQKPKIWNGYWWLATYDLPKEKNHLRNVIRHYFIQWGFFPIQESVYLHAFTCREEVIFLREYFGLGEYVKVFKVDEIENEKTVKEFFGL